MSAKVKDGEKKGGGKKGGEKHIPEQIWTLFVQLCIKLNFLFFLFYFQISSCVFYCS